MSRDGASIWFEDEGKAQSIPVTILIAGLAALPDLRGEEVIRTLRELAQSLIPPQHHHQIHIANSKVRGVPCLLVQPLIQSRALSGSHQTADDPMDNSA